MRCLACNNILNDYEATRRSYQGEFLDLCSHCRPSASATEALRTREDLKHVCDVILDIQLTDNE
jgi:hypothetical protein